MGFKWEGEFKKDSNLEEVEKVLDMAKFIIMIITTTITIIMEFQ